MHLKDDPLSFHFRIERMMIECRTLQNHINRTRFILGNYVDVEDDAMN